MGSRPILVDTTTSLKTFRITGSLSVLREIEDTTETWAHWKDRTLEMPGVRMAVDALRRVVPESEISYTARAETLIQEAENFSKLEDENNRLRKQNSFTVDDYEFDGVYPPWDHQVKAFMLGREREEFGYFMEMGTGKTRVVIDTAAYLHEQNEIDLCVVLGPNGVHRQWVQDEIPNWMPKRVPLRPWTFRPSRKLPSDWLEQDECLRFYTLNIEQMSHASGVKRLKDLLASVKDKRALVAIDESSLISNPAAKRTSAIVELGEMARYRRILDGLPISKGVHQLYSQFLFLNKRIVGVSSFTGFRNRYCRMGGYEGRAIVGYKNVSELMERVTGHTYRVRKEEALDLPRKMPPTKRYVEMSDEQRKYYTKMRDDYFIKLDNGEIIDGTIGAVKIMRLHQIVCGHLPKTPTQPWQPIKNNRIESTKSILQQVDGKTIIWCRWVPDVVQLAEKLGEGFVEYSGRVNQSDRERALWKLENDPNTLGLIGQIAAGGVGLNMTAANNTIYYSNSPSLRLRKQSEDRTHRGGQTRVCSYWDLFIPNSTDGLIMDILKNDYDLATKALDSEYLAQFL